MAFLLLLAGGTIAAAAQAVPCTSDWDCSLNGICTAGACVCDAGWTTLPHGVNNAMLPGCGYLDFLPANTSACGPACAFHGGVNDNTSTSSWGGSVIELNSSNGTREFWMYAAEFANHCDLGAWGTNSQVVAAVSSAPTGPFIRQNVAVPTWSHNPEVIRAPDGTLIIFTLGSGKPNGALQNCSGSTGSVYMHGVASATSSIPSVGLKYSRSGRRSHVPANFTLHSSRSPLGPWAATTVQIEGWNASWNLGNWNPAPVMLPDGSVRVMAHTSYVGWSGEVILEAPSWKGPYKVVGSDLIDHCEYCEEDPFMWRDTRGNWHVLYHRMFDGEGRLDPNWGKTDGSWHHTRPIPSPGFAGGHAFSRDGLNWSAWNRCFDTGVVMHGGEKLWMLRRERPKLLMDAKNRPTHLYSGAIGPCGYKAGKLGCSPRNTVRSSTIVVPLNVPQNHAI